MPLCDAAVSFPGAKVGVGVALGVGVAVAVAALTTTGYVLVNTTVEIVLSVLTALIVRVAFPAATAVICPDVLFTVNTEVSEE